MDWLYFFLGISAGVALKLILYSDDVSRGKLLLAGLKTGIKEGGCIIKNFDATSFFMF